MEYSIEKDNDVTALAAASTTLNLLKTGDRMLVHFKSRFYVNSMRHKLVGKVFRYGVVTNNNGLIMSILCLKQS